MQKIIIAGFPGVGKTTAAKTLNGIVLDLDSSKFHWTTDTDNKTSSEEKSKNKVQCDPEWPGNYVNLIKMIYNETEGISDYKDLIYICISTHSEVLERLRQDKIPFVIVRPETKEIMIDRYKNRGNSEAFIEKIDKNWSEWMDNLGKYGMPIITLLEDNFLIDVLDRLSVYDYLKDKIDDIVNRVFPLDNP